MILQIFTLMVMGVGLSSTTFIITLQSDNLDCYESGIQCVNDTSYTLCANIQNLTILSNNLLFCPEGYYCDNKTHYPCITAAEKNATDAATTTTTSTTLTTPTTTTTSAETTTTATETTTKAKVARPTEAPTCEAEGLLPAPACNQYYECVSAKCWIFWPCYNSELKTCADGLYYDTGLQICILAALSDCEE